MCIRDRLEPTSTWTMAQQYVELGVQSILKKNYVVLIYTDNTNPYHSTQFIDPTPGTTSNPDSNPGGLLLVNHLPVITPDFPTSSLTSPLAWTIKDQKDHLGFLAPADPNEAATNPNAPQWFYIKDKNTPFIDPNPDVEGDEIQPFDISNPEDYVRINEGQYNVSPLAPKLAHFVQGDSVNRGFFASSGLDYVYFEAMFPSPIAQVVYKSPIYFDLLTE